MFGSVWTYFYWYFRPILKWFLRKTTGFCELQRICYGSPTGAPRIQGVETSLKLSRRPEIKELIIYLNNVSAERRLSGNSERDVLQNSIYTILRVKKINPKVHTRFPTLFGRCIEQIWGYKQLYEEIELLRTTPYSSEDALHEEKLMHLWSLLMPEQPLESRISKQWQIIGFQGDDPKTDFRGMGLLGLENLLYFAEEYPGPSSHVLSHSHHPVYGYAFAIVGINLTSLAYHLLKDGSAKTHMYNISKSLPSIRLFHQLYCYLFYEFDKYWIESKPKNIMDFSHIHEKFEKNIRESLMIQTTVFRMNISVDNV